MPNDTDATQPQRGQRPIEQAVRLIQAALDETLPGRTAFIDTLPDYCGSVGGSETVRVDPCASVRNDRRGEVGLLHYRAYYLAEHLIPHKLRCFDCWADAVLPFDLCDHERVWL